MTPPVPRRYTTAMRYLLAILVLIPTLAMAAELPAPFDTELGHKYRAELAFVQVPASRARDRDIGRHDRCPYYAAISMPDVLQRDSRGPGCPVAISVVRWRHGKINGNW